MVCDCSQDRVFVLILMFFVVASAAVDGIEAQSQRKAFVTSVSGTGNLGSWADAGGETGADAGDTICRARAAAAGLANAGSFVAWLSTSTDDAYCRLHEFGGAKANNCGRGVLPQEAGPWTRTDSAPFSESIDRLLSPEKLVYYPLSVDEYGNPVEGVTFTGTYADGTWLPHFGTCNDWTFSSPAFAWKGTTTRSSGSWTSGGNIRCDATAHLFCFEPGPGETLSAPDETGNFAFVTSVQGSGNFASWAEAGGKTGLDAADAVCQARAISAGLPHPSTYRAWISDSGTDAVDRFPRLGPIVRLDGVKVVHAFDDLVNGPHLASLNLTETFVYLGNNDAWTGSNGSGIFLGPNCFDWASSDVASSGRTGAVNATNSSWATEWISVCSSMGPRLYCMGDSSVIFSSSFLFGDTSAWSLSVP